MRATSSRPYIWRAAVVAVTGASLLSGCSSGSEASSAAKATEHAGSGAAATSGQHELDAAYRRILGGAKGQAAVDLASYIKAQNTMRSCLHRAGITYLPQAYDATERTEPTVGSAFVESWDLGPVDAASVRQHALGIADTITAARNPTNRIDGTTARPVDPERFRKEGYACSGHLTLDNAYPGDSVPYLPQRMLDELANVVTVATKAPSVVRADASYAKCAAATGFPGVEDTGGLLDQIGREFPRSDEPVSGDKWDRAVADEKKAAAVDATCRAPAHTAILAALAAPLSHFESDHAGDLTDIDAFWVKTEADTVKLAKANPWVTAG
jgi:hypothetical protein